MSRTPLLLRIRHYERGPLDLANQEVGLGRLLECWMTPASGSNRLGWQATEPVRVRCNAGVNPKSGYTGYFIPRRDLADIGPGAMRLSDVPCKAISPRVDKAYFHEKDVEILQRPDTNIRRVVMTSWLDAARWNASQLAKDMAVFTLRFPFPATAKFDQNGFLMPGQQFPPIGEGFRINWTWLQDAVYDLYQWRYALKDQGQIDLAIAETLGTSQGTPSSDATMVKVVVSTPVNLWSSHGAGSASELQAVINAAIVSEGQPIEWSACKNTSG